MKQIRVGVIGVGRMGQHHCRVYSSLRNAHFVGIYDTNLDLAAQISQKYEVTRFDSVDELFDQVDAVSITTTTPPHFDLAMRCIDQGVHALVEKPLTASLEQAEILTQAAEAGNVVVLVGHIERFNPAYIELKNVLEKMTVLAINFRRLSPFAGSNTDVDVVLDLMTHDLDLVLDLIHETPVSINAAGFHVFSDNIDHAAVQIGFVTGPVVTMTASRITEQKIRAIDVTAKGAYLEADLLNKTISVHRRSLGEYLHQNRSNIKYRQESIVERILVPNIEPLLSEIQHFLHCISEGLLPLVSARDGLEALRLACKVRDTILQHPQDVLAESVPGYPANG